ncbi:MAG: response regulator, partial [Candidatus Rokuibacteriota bacterium]
MAHAMARVERDELDARLTVTTASEFAALYEGFNRMAGRLQDLIDARAELTVLQAREHFRSLIEHASDLITVLDAAGTIGYESPSAERVLGARPETLVGRPMAELLDPDGGARLAAVLEELVREPESGERRLELRARHRDGSWRVLESTATRAVDASGQVVVVVNSHDVTERKRAERAQWELFQENRRKLEELSMLYELSRAVTGELEVGHVAEAIRREVPRALDARNMAIVLWNEARQAFEVVLRWTDGVPDPGMPEAYVSGHGLVGVIVRERRAVRTADYTAACREAGVEPLAADLPYPCWLGVPVAAGDRLFGVLALRRAAGAFTEADERLLTNVAGLAALAIRTAGLYAEKTRAYGELARAQDQLVQTERLRALGEMAAGVAHDFNNVLAVVIGRADLLLTRTHEPGVVDSLRAVRGAALDGAQTVRRIQEFTRTRRARPAGRVEVPKILTEVVELTRTRWKDEAQSRGVRYDVRVDAEEVAPVTGLAEELREVFINLLMNALEAMPAGGQLVLEARMTPDGVVVRARDTGSGMSEETRRRVFEPFFTTKGPRGTGLGLAVVWGILQRHGAAIDVASTVGVGTTFTIRFPRGEAPSAEAVAAPVPPAVAGARILVVDDEAQVRAVLAAVLHAQGYAVLEAGDGAEAIARCAEERVDLVLSDLSMPGMSGWDVAAACRGRFPELPVGLVTGWGDQLDPQEIQRTGVRFVVAKPFDAKELLRAVATALGGAR